MAAFAPSPEAIIILFPKTSVTSPAANIPGKEVEQSGLIIISPFLFSVFNKSLQVHNTFDSNINFIHYNPLSVSYTHRVPGYYFSHYLLP